MVGGSVGFHLFSVLDCCSFLGPCIKVISTNLYAQGRGLARSLMRPYFAISTYSPRAGKRPWFYQDEFHLMLFQPTLPSHGEETTVGEIGFKESIISTHSSPHGKRPVFYYPRCSSPDFNPLFPHGKRLTRRKQSMRLRNFNPLFPAWGRDKQIAWANTIRNISTHSSPHGEETRGT